MNALLTVDEVSELLQISRSLVYMLANAGELESVASESGLCFQPYDVQKFIVVHLVDNRCHDRSWNEWGSCY